MISAGVGFLPSTVPSYAIDKNQLVDILSHYLQEGYTSQGGAGFLPSTVGS